MRLARDIYDTRCEAFGLRPVMWSQLPPSLRQQFVETAIAVLETLRPMPRTSPPTLRLVDQQPVA